MRTASVLLLALVASVTVAVADVTTTTVAPDAVEDVDSAVAGTMTTSIVGSANTNASPKAPSNLNTNAPSTSSTTDAVPQISEANRVPVPEPVPVAQDDSAPTQGSAPEATAGTTGAPPADATGAAVTSGQLFGLALAVGAYLL